MAPYGFFFFSAYRTSSKGMDHEVDLKALILSTVEGWVHTWFDKLTMSGFISFIYRTEVEPTPLLDPL
jgi:hypothetical protein